MERYKPLPRMHGAGGPSSPRGGDVDRNVSARLVKAAYTLVAARRHRIANRGSTVPCMAYDFFVRLSIRP